jgi:hypothetical protein
VKAGIPARVSALRGFVRDLLDSHKATKKENDGFPLSREW